MIARPKLSPKVFLSYPYLYEEKNKKAHKIGLFVWINSDKIGIIRR